jgi:hypothetical protein
LGEEVVRDNLGDKVGGRSVKNVNPKDPMYVVVVVEAGVVVRDGLMKNVQQKEGDGREGMMVGVQMDCDSCVNDNKRVRFQIVGVSRLRGVVESTHPREVSSCLPSD